MPHRKICVWRRKKSSHKFAGATKSRLCLIFLQLPGEFDNFWSILAGVSGETPSLRCSNSGERLLCRGRISAALPAWNRV
jgi:hypothetical protein